MGQPKVSISPGQKGKFVKRKLLRQSVQMTDPQRSPLGQACEGHVGCPDSKAGTGSSAHRAPPPGRDHSHPHLTGC